MLDGWSVRGYRFGGGLAVALWSGGHCLLAERDFVVISYFLTINNVLIVGIKLYFCLRSEISVSPTVIFHLLVVYGDVGCHPYISGNGICMNIL